MERLAHDEPGTFDVVTSPAARYRISVNDDSSATMTRNPAPFDMQAASWSSSLYRDGDSLSCHITWCRVGQPARLIFFKRIEDVTYFTERGLLYTGTERRTSPVVSIERVTVPLAPGHG